MNDTPHIYHCTHAHHQQCVGTLSSLNNYEYTVNIQKTRFDAHERQILYPKH